MRILLIEDDRALCAALQPALTGAGYTVDTCHDGADGRELLCGGSYDVCILDRMLPGLDGLSLLRTARTKGCTTPVLMLTALSGINDRVDGLDAGADDYLGKPFDTRELLARLRALTRRPGTSAETAVHCGDVTLDAAQLTLTGPHASVGLTKRECDLLEALLRAPGQLQSRSALLARVWGPLAEVEDANLDCYIHFIRRRLNTVGSTVKIVTVRGSGYKAEAGL
ncbi:response regulator transcription factor [Gemmiger sp.]